MKERIETEWCVRGGGTAEEPTRLPLTEEDWEMGGFALKWWGCRGGGGSEGVPAKREV